MKVLFGDWVINVKQQVFYLKHQKKVLQVLDGEEPIKENYDKSRRVHRGLFVSNNGTKINADVNGSYQITKKAFPNAYSNGIVGVGLHPTVVNIPL